MDERVAMSLDFRRKHADALKRAPVERSVEPGFNP